MYNQRMEGHGAYLYTQQSLSMRPFRSRVFLVTNNYDLDCLVNHLKLTTDVEIAPLLDWSLIDATEQNYALFNIRANFHTAAYHIIYAPIIERLAPGDYYLGLLSRLLTMVTGICVEVVNLSGYDPLKSPVTFSHLVAAAQHDLCLIAGRKVNGALTMATNDQRDVMTSLNNQQWDAIACLTSVELYSAALNQLHYLNNGLVFIEDNGWSATTYYS